MPSICFILIFCLSFFESIALEAAANHPPCACNKSPLDVISFSDLKPMELKEIDDDASPFLYTSKERNNWKHGPSSKTKGSPIIEKSHLKDFKSKLTSLPPSSLPLKKDHQSPVFSLSNGKVLIQNPKKQYENYTMSLMERASKSEKETE
jgi:hypothetical protein